MKFIATDRDVPHSAAEVCLNLWYMVDATGVVLRLAGKAYALTGTDDQKLAALHLMAGADYLTAAWDMVPSQFCVISEHGEIQGAIPVAGIHQNQGAVFESLMKQIEREIPKVIHLVGKSYEQIVAKIPQNPLCVTTAVYERPDGGLIARVGKRAQHPN